MDIPSELSVCRGRIFHSTIFTQTPIGHSKFFVVMGEDETHVVGYFFINTHISNSVQQKKPLFELQFPIKKEEYPFLSHASYIGCHDIKRISKKELAQSIDEGRTKNKGLLKDHDMELILDVVRNSDVFSDIEKDKFFK